MKKLILVYVVLIVAVILLAIVKTGGKLSIPNFFGSASAQVNGKTINLIMAKSDKERQLGLSGRKSLDQNQGMLFVFAKKDIYPFWMKDMLFPIDIIYIDTDTVAYIVENAAVPTQGSILTVYKPTAPANYVLELNAGQAKKLNITKGTKITLKGI